MYRFNKNKLLLVAVLIISAQSLLAHKNIPMIDDNGQLSSHEFVTTPLHELVIKQYSSLQAKLEAIQTLLDQGVQINARNEDRRTPLWLATFYGVQPQIIALLIRYGANVMIPDIFNVTPLHNAVQRDDKIVAKILLDAGAEINPHIVEKMVLFKDDGTDTPLDNVKTPEMNKVLLEGACIV